MTKVAKQLNQGAKASLKASRNLTKVLRHKKTRVDPLTWRIESSMEGAAKRIQELQLGVQEVVKTFEEMVKKYDVRKDNWKYHRVRSTLEEITNSAIRARVILARINELQEVEVELATAREK